ncbi:hypothetical protein WKR88_13855, partial [Trinickia caryophylli]|uniref:hypothetical protein n=1 Tax=Trinickia caryophylli TaxID=28094 RepID=UPI0030BE5467
MIFASNENGSGGSPVNAGALNGIGSVAGIASQIGSLAGLPGAGLIGGAARALLVQSGYHAVARQYDVAHNDVSSIQESIGIDGVHVRY